MRILNLQAENVKRIKVIDITPDGNVVIISGKNGEGKTSILDSIWLACDYREAIKENRKPVRAGTDKGKTKIDLGEYIVTRQFNSKGTTQLKITTPDGKIVPSPQKILDGMIGDLSFDPWEFTRMKEKEQRQVLSDLLFKISDGSIDIANIEIDRKKLYENRTNANKEKRRLDAYLGTLKPAAITDSSEEILATDLLKEIGDASTSNSRYGILSKDIKKLTADITAMQLVINEKQEELDSLQVVDLDALKEKLEGVEAHNRRAREIGEYKSTLSQIEAVDKEIGEYKDDIELCDIRKAEAIENAPFPVKNFAIREEGIMTKSPEDEWIPFSQASSAQQLRISLAIAMTANPTLRVIRIADGSLLDDTSMKILEEMASDEDFQIWVEYASRNDKDKMGVYIEDGRVESEGNEASWN